MTNDEATTGGPVGSRRVPRQGMGGAPVGSTLSIVLAVVAVVAGFLILRNITGDSDTTAGGTTADDATTITTVAGDAAALPTTVAPTTTVPTDVRVTEGASVLVANANTVGGSAGAMTRTLTLAEYTLVEPPVNATGPNVDDSIVYYDASVAAARDVAESVARDLGGLTVLELPTPAPVDSASIGDAGVLLLLGNNQAGRSIEELSAANTAEAANEAPAPAGSDTTSDTTADTTADTAADG